MKKHKLLLTGLLILTLLIPNSQAASNKNFSPPTTTSLDAYPLHPGYPIETGLWVDKAGTTVADINNDGQKELLMGNYSGQLLAWNAFGAPLPGFPLTTGTRFMGLLTVGDLNGDGDLEVAAATSPAASGEGAKVYIWNPDGTLLSGWPQTTACTAGGHCSIISINFADLNNDSVPEIIAASTNRSVSPNRALYSPSLYVWRPSGQLLSSSWPVEDELNVPQIGYSAIGDMDRDGYNDIVLGRDYNRLFVYNRSGAFLPGWPHYVWWPVDRNNWNDDQIEFSRSSATLADLNGDGDLEFIVAGIRRLANTTWNFYNTDLLVYNTKGSRWVRWESTAEGAGLLSPTLSHRTIQAPAIADMDKDGDPDIVVATQDGWVRAYTAEKKLLWAYQYVSGSVYYATETVIGDVDNDGYYEVVFGTFDGNLEYKGTFGIYILEHDGTLKPGSPLQVEAPGVSGAPSLSDLDGDGLIEISAASWNGRVFVWDTPGQALTERLPWPVPRRDLQRTGLYHPVAPNFSHSYQMVSDVTPRPGDTITFDITLLQSGVETGETLTLTNTLPFGLEYVPGSLSAPSGTVDDSQPKTLKWTGTMPAGKKITIRYSATLTLSAHGVITNTAVLTGQRSGTYQIKAYLLISGLEFFLPELSR